MIDSRFRNQFALTPCTGSSRVHIIIHHIRDGATRCEITLGWIEHFHNLSQCSPHCLHTLPTHNHPPLQSPFLCLTPFCPWLHRNHQSSMSLPLSILEEFYNTRRCCATTKHSRPPHPRCQPPANLTRSSCLLRGPSSSPASQLGSLGLSLEWLPSGSQVSVVINIILFYLCSTFSNRTSLRFKTRLWACLLCWKYSQVIALQEQQKNDLQRSFCFIIYLFYTKRVKPRFTKWGNPM